MLIAFANSKDSEQPAHSRRLVKDFAALDLDEATRTKLDSIVL